MTVMVAQPPDDDDGLLALDRRAVALLFQAAAHPEDEQLREAAAAAMVAAIRARGGEGGVSAEYRASEALLDEAERHLDAAEATDDPEERRRQLALFELAMAAAGAS